MSDVDERLDAEVEADDVCASCGKVAVDEIKLKKCACNLVKYCSVDCQQNHRRQHKKACKKRLSEIHDDCLFTQPDESHLGECPICCLPLPLDSEPMPCCSKSICNGCIAANMSSNVTDRVKASSCVYCREQWLCGKEILSRVTERVKANDPIGMRQMGRMRYDEKDFNGAFEYMSKAAELGDIEAHYIQGKMYHEGKGVKKDEKKAVYHWEQAAIGGHPQARCLLAVIEEINGSIERAVKHFIIAANLGLDEALEAVKKRFQRGLVSKEDFEAALRGHQAAVDAMKSEQRKTAEKYLRRADSLM